MGDDEVVEAFVHLVQACGSTAKQDGSVFGRDGSMARLEVAVQPLVEAVRIFLLGTRRWEVRHALPAGEELPHVRTPCDAVTQLEKVGIGDRRARTMIVLRLRMAFGVGKRTEITTVAA